MLALNEALESLSKIDARKSRVVELRYFGGLNIEETAEILGISPETAKRDWRIAQGMVVCCPYGRRIACGFNNKSIHQRHRSQQRHLEMYFHSTGPHYSQMPFFSALSAGFRAQLLMRK